MIVGDPRFHSSAMTIENSGNEPPLALNFRLVSRIYRCLYVQLISLTFVILNMMQNLATGF